MTVILVKDECRLRERLHDAVCVTVVDCTGRQWRSKDFIPLKTKGLDESLKYYKMQIQGLFIIEDARRLIRVFRSSGTTVMINWGD